MAEQQVIDRNVPITKNPSPRELIFLSEVKAVPRHYQQRKSTYVREENIRINKRMLDLLISFIGLLVFLCILPFFAIAIKLSSRGPVFFKQERIGERGRPFVCYKFRTMHTNSKEQKEDGKPNITQRGDYRIFKFGHFLRQNNLDELPQLFNVFKGDMSLIGPRPYMVAESDYWREEFTDYKKREMVKPGLSGLAQVNGYRGGILDKEHMRTRLDYDLLYVQSYNTSIDMMIIWRTVLQMLNKNTNAH